MTPSEYIDLRCGGSRGLNLAHVVVTLLAGLVILFTHSAWSWKALTIAALLLTHVASSRKMKKNGMLASLRLFNDGSAILEYEGEEAQMLRASHAWVSRWICVLPLRGHPGADIIYCMVLASNNHSDNYRQLLASLRMRSASGQQGFIW
jgi:hypothetical protein